MKTPFTNSKIIDRDLGFDEIQEQLKFIDNSYVLIGFQEGSKTKGQFKKKREKKAGESMPEIAAKNEFGSGRIPARPFMSTSFDENKDKITSYSKTQYDKILKGKQTTNKALEYVGEAMVGLIRKKIRQILTPPNAPYTIAQKGSSKPLIDFGQMIQSVLPKVELRK